MKYDILWQVSWFRKNIVIWVFHVNYRVHTCIYIPCIQFACMHAHIAHNLKLKPCLGLHTISSGGTCPGLHLPGWHRRPGQSPYWAYDGGGLRRRQIPNMWGLCRGKSPIQNWRWSEGVGVCSACIQAPDFLIVLVRFLCHINTVLQCKFICCTYPFRSWYECTKGW